MSFVPLAARRRCLSITPGPCSLRSLATEATQPSSPPRPPHPSERRSQHQHYERRRQQHREPRPLPQLKSSLPKYLTAAAVASVSWAIFLGYTMNYEKASSSVVRTLIYKLKTSPMVQEALGDDIKPVPFILKSDPWISGSVNLLQGSVDVSFPIQGSKDHGTAMFTSIRRSAESRFEILRWKVILPDGRTVDLRDEQAQDDRVLPPRGPNLLGVS